MLSNKWKNLFTDMLLIFLGLLFLILFIKFGILLGIISILIIFYLVKKYNLKKFTLILFSFALITRLIAVFILKPPIELDFAVLYNASNALLKGDLSFTNTSYFRLWGYQMGQVLYQTLLLKIWFNPLIIKIGNAVISSGTVLLIYFISKEIFKEKTARVVSLLYSIFMFPLLFNTVLSNQILSTFLTYFAIYLLFSKKFIKMNSYVKYLLVGLTLGLANIIRPEGIVILTTLILFSIYYLIKSNFIDTIKKVGIIFLSYLVITNLCSYLLIVTNVSPIGLSNKDPLWKFVLGFNYESVGMYDRNDDYLVGNSDLEIKVIKERTIGNIAKLPILFVKKTNNFWLSVDLYWSNNYLENETVNILGFNLKGHDINQVLINYSRCIYYFMFGCLFLGLYKNRKKEKNEITTFLQIMILVYALVYLLIEIMPRYVYLPQVGLFILSGFGIEYILEKMLERK